jgi:hypothetical protein
MADEIKPIPVRLTNSAELLAGMGAARPRKHTRAVYRTFLLAANTPLPVLAEDLSRRDVWFVAYNNSVMICESLSQAQDPGNQVAGAGNFANTPANPQGTLLYAYAAGNPAVMASVRWTLETTEVVWAVAMATAYLAITTHNKSEGY